MLSRQVDVGGEGGDGRGWRCTAAWFELSFTTSSPPRGQIHVKAGLARMG